MAYNYNVKEALKKGTAAPADILNTPGLSTYKGTATSYNPVPTSTSTKKPVTTPVISAQTLTQPKASPVRIQQKPIGTSASASSAMMSDVQTQSETMKAEQARKDALAPKVSAGESAMREYYDKLAGKGSAQIMAESEAGIPKLNQELTDITNQIEAKQLAARREIERIQDNKAGLFGGAVQQEVNRIERESARELADLSIIQNARNRNLSTAQDLVNRKIDLEYGDLKDKIEAEKFFYQENKEDLNKAEQNILNERIRQDEREYDKSVNLEKAKQDLIIKASENQNVPIDIIQKAQKATDTASVASILSPYMVDPIERAYKQAQISNIYQNIAESKAKMIPTATGGITKELTEAMSRVNQINNVLNNPNFNDAFGLKGLYSTAIPGSPAIATKNQVQQIIDVAALAARGELKGQGQISDFEGRMLANAQTALKFTMSADDARRELAQVRGAITTSSGNKAPVLITDKKGVSKPGMADSQTITDAINSGYTVIYQ